MLNSKHFEVLKYISKSNKIFPHTDIKGGVIIFYYDLNREFE